jgi:hypothetical protein
MSISAMKQALEALESWQKTCLDVGRASDELGRATKAIQPLRQAIAEAEKQEPVAFVSGYYGGQCVILPIYKDKLFSPGTALYTAPVHASDISQEPVDETAKREHEFEEMVKRGTKAWADTPDDWVDELRGGVEKREWVGLTKTELIKLGVFPFGMSYELYEAIEQALREKNT